MCLCHRSDGGGRGPGADPDGRPGTNSEARPMYEPECLPGLLLGRPSGQELPGAYVIAQMEAGVALLVVKMVAQARIPKRGRCLSRMPARAIPGKAKRTGIVGRLCHHPDGGGCGPGGQYGRPNTSFRSKADV